MPIDSGTNRYANGKHFKLLHLDFKGGKRIGSLDFGNKKMGFAVSDPEHRIARPHSVYKRRDEIRDIQHIGNFIQENNIGLLVFGTPIETTGGKQSQIFSINEFANKVKASIGCDIYFQDESFSTKDAVLLLRRSGVSKKRTKESDDMIAASIILQRTLDLIKFLKQSNTTNLNLVTEMKCISKNLYVGSQENFFESAPKDDEWSFVQAAKDPFFAKEYNPRYSDSNLFVRKNNLIALNLCDTTPIDDILKMAEAAITFINDNIRNKNVLVHCNHGISRSPSIALMYLIRQSEQLKLMHQKEIIGWYKDVYKPYSPTKTMLEATKAFLSAYKDN